MKSSSLYCLGYHGRGCSSELGTENHAIETAIEYNRLHAGTDHITIPYLADEDLVKEAVQKIVLTSKKKLRKGGNKDSSSPTSPYKRGNYMAKNC